jgi:hypothetical protein
VRAAVLANPSGLVLMQSRSPARVQRNVEAAGNPANDELVLRILQLLEPRL